MIWVETPFEHLGRCVFMGRIRPAQCQNPKKNSDLLQSGADSGAVDADLQRIIDTWPELPVITRESILIKVRDAKH